jgi:hypothetical protein
VSLNHNCAQLNSFAAARAFSLRCEDAGTLRI